MADDISILHVDDQSAFTEATAAFLEREDERFDIEAVTSPAAGLEHLADATVDCIVSDYNMPEQNGIEFLQAVRERYPELPFFLFTGKGNEEIASEAISAGVTDYIQKQGDKEQYTLLANRIKHAVEKYRTERELDKTRSQYRKLVEQNFVGIYIIQDGEFVYVNPKLAAIHGYEREQIIGMSPMELVAPEERERVEGNIKRRLGGDVEDIQYQTVGLTSDGGRIDIELHGSRIEHDGRPAIIGTELDITERKRQQRELERKNERLESFASVVSHDLRNPLAVLQSALDTAEQTGEPEHFERSQRAVERMTQLIDDLLTLARTGGERGDLEPVALGDFTETCWQTVETAEATLVTETTQTIMADPDRMRQLIENLLGNAVEHGGESVTVTVSDLDEQRGFAVTDDGTGILPEEREQVFDGGYSTSDGGTGFGLAIVEEVATAHGWAISVTEGEAGGARFELTGVERVDDGTPGA